MRRGDALDEQGARAEQNVDGTRDPSLGRRQQRLDVATGRIEVLAFVHHVPVGLRHGILDARLLAGQHQLFEFAVRRQEHFGGGSLEGNAPLGPDHGVSQMDAAPDAERPRQRFEPLDDGDGRQCFAVEAVGNAGGETDDMPLRNSRVGECLLRQHPRIVGNAAGRRQRFLAADGDSPEAAVHRIGAAKRWNGQSVILQIAELLGALERAVAHRRNDFQIRRQGPQRHFETHLVVARGRAAVRHHRGTERQSQLCNGLRL